MKLTDADHAGLVVAAQAGDDRAREELFARYLPLLYNEKRKLSIGTCGRAFSTPCIHEHACLRCAMLRPDPVERPRLVEIRDNLMEASPKPSRKTGSAKSKASKPASLEPRRSSPRWTPPQPARPQRSISGCPASPRSPDAPAIHEDGYASATE
ncbi:MULTISPECIES: hypothetical protein [unclassified Streptomyces]|uniref:hypothetical protein n=1 Tax=unclassified Streptomyces TaxID=2593676 RepID=UPI001EF1E5BC|nr:MULTISPECIES: hypothetical protein [unclassified Streptomyces]